MNNLQTLDRGNAAAVAAQAGTTSRTPPFPMTRIALVLALATLASCASYPSRPAGADALRARLTQLQADPDLGRRAPLALQDADAAVTAAEQPQSDPVVGEHLVFIADRRIEIARAVARSHLAVDQRQGLSDQRAQMRLDERTQEADSANRRTAVATAESGNQKRMADSARQEASAARNDATLARTDADAAQRQAEDANIAAGAARDATADANDKASEMRRELDEMQARPTDRGLVVTLGDVLFAFGTAQINTGGSDHLNKLAGFLADHPDRTALIEGYTDNVGGADYNQGLSQRRAEAVKGFLVGKGIDASRLAASGKGKDAPVGDNGSATGRQQNRRVEVVISNPLVSSR